MMATAFNPRTVLRQVSNSLLREFFLCRRELNAVPWDDLSERSIGPVLEGINQFPPESRREVFDVLMAVHSLATIPGAVILHEELEMSHRHLLKKFSAMESLADRAMLVYLNAREAFEQAVRYAQVERLTHSRTWTVRRDLPRKALGVTSETLRALEQGVSSLFMKKELRGGKCVAEHSVRRGRIDHFFIYLDNYPDKQPVFDEKGEGLVMSRERPTFQVVFVYDAADGSLSLAAPGGKKFKHPLEAAFGKAVLGVDLGPAESDKPAYSLQHLLEHNFPLAIDPTEGATAARLTKLRLVPRAGGSSVLLTVDAGTGTNAIYEHLQRWFKAESLSPASVRVVMAEFAISLIPHRSGRSRGFRFVVTPDSCSLKNEHEDNRLLGERCMRKWGIAPQLAPDAHWDLDSGCLFSSCTPPSRSVLATSGGAL